MSAQPKVVNMGATSYKSWLSSPSFEITTGHKEALETLSGRIAPGANIYIASLPKDTFEKQYHLAKRVYEAGFNPVPHIAARKIKTARHLEKHVSNLCRTAGVTRMLVIAGDREKPIGDFSDSLEVIRSGILKEYGITSIDMAGHPEEHPDVDSAILERFLIEKLDAAQSQGLNAEILTQLCFDPDILLAYVRHLRRCGVNAPIRIGVAGLTNRLSLMKYAAICGVGQSLKALQSRRDTSRNLLKSETPDRLLLPLSDANDAECKLGISGMHIYSFGSLTKTLAWTKAQTQ